MVIVGGGAAGFAAAEMLRREGFDGTITMLSCDAASPVDRPNLSKDYLAGKAPEDWVPLRPPAFYSENDIGLQLATEVTRIDPGLREVSLADGNSVRYDRCCLQPEPSRSVFGFPALTGRKSIPFGHSPTAGLSSREPKQRVKQ
jgi:NADPH-dependent 2,4-dienoyl-CoA reductase/sulfur reductase-like enzyme